MCSVVLPARSVSVVEGPGVPLPVDGAAEAFAALCDRAAERGLLVHVEFWPGSALDLVTAAAVVASAMGYLSLGYFVSRFIVWIAIVATTHSLRTHGYTAWAAGLITAGTVLACLLAVGLWRVLRARNVRKIPEQAADASTFPVPPLPAAKEKADA